MKRVCCNMGGVVFCVAFTLLTTTLTNAQNLKQQALKTQSQARLCVGCIPELELLRVYLTWENINDFDMHVFGPGPRLQERREIYYGNKEDIIDSFGEQRCDDRGSTGTRGTTCEIRGERFTVSSRATKSKKPRPYCFAVRLYGEKKTTDLDWSLLVAMEGNNIWSCTGRHSGDKTHEDTDRLSTLSNDCKTVAVQKEPSWSGMIELDPLHDPEAISKENVKAVGSISCTPH